MFKSKKDYTANNPAADELIVEEGKKMPTAFEVTDGDTSIVLFFASILCRLAYEPPNYYQLFLLKILNLFSEKTIVVWKLNLEHNALTYLYDTLKAARDAKTQDKFVEVLKNSIIKDLNHDKLAQDINEITKSALNTETRKAAAKAIRPGMQKIESYLTTNGFIDDKDKIMFQQPESSPSSTEGAPNPSVGENLRKNIGEIKTIYLQSSEDLNVYVTAFVELNSIFVTFRGSNSPKNIASDLNFKKSGKGYTNCLNDKKFQELLKEWGKGRGFYEEKKTDVDGKPIEVSSEEEAELFKGVTSLLGTSIHTFTYTVIRLALWLKKKRATTVPAQVFTFGHSLGGGLATLYSYKYPEIYDYINKVESFNMEVGTQTTNKKLRLDEFLKPNIIGISNAAPRILGKSAETKFHEMMRSGRIKFIRQWTKGDWITALPKESILGGFVHPKQGQVKWDPKRADTDMIKTVIHENRMAGPGPSLQVGRWKQGPLNPIFGFKGHGQKTLGFPWSHSHQNKMNLYQVGFRVTGPHSTGTVKKQNLEANKAQAYGADVIKDILEKEKKVVKKDIKDMERLVKRWGTDLDPTKKDELEEAKDKAACIEKQIELATSLIKEVTDKKPISILLAEMMSSSEARDQNPLAETDMALFKNLIIHTIQNLQLKKHTRDETNRIFTGHSVDKDIESYDTFEERFYNNMLNQEMDPWKRKRGGKRRTKRNKKHKFRTTRKRHKRHNIHKKRNTRKRHKRRKSLRKKTRKH